MILTTLFAFTASLRLWSLADAASAAAQRGVINTLTARVQALSAKAAQLPEIRRRLAALKAAQLNAQALPDDASLLQMFTAAAVKSGVQLDAFEPNEAATAPHWRERHLQLRVSGPFPALARFSARLAAMPLPVVPISAQLRAQADQLSLATSLRVISAGSNSKAPPPALVTEIDQSAGFADPFARQNAPFPPAGVLQLVGVFRRARGRAALVQTTTGFVLLRVGDAVGAEVVTRIGNDWLALARGAHLTRTLSLHAPSAVSQPMYNRQDRAQKRARARA